jgi:hypothetical protein
MHTSHCSSGKCLILYSCQWNWIWALAMCMQSYGALAIIRCVPSGSCIYCRPYRWSDACQHHWAFAVVPCWGWYVSAAERWVMRHAVTFAPMGIPENMQWEHSISPMKKSPCHKHMQVKWCRQCSSTENDLCLWKPHMPQSVETETVKHLKSRIPRPRTNVTVNSPMPLSCCTMLIPHVAQRVQDQLNTMQWWEMLKYTAYSLDLPLYHLYVFETLKAIKDSKHNPQRWHHWPRIKS